MGDSAGGDGRTTGKSLAALEARLITPKVAGDVASPIIDEVDSSQHLAISKQLPKPFPGLQEARGEGGNGPSAYYWPYDQLDELPQVLEDVDLNIPEIYASSRGGKVFVTLLINVNGYVDEVLVENDESHPGMLNLSRVLVERFQGARFAPGRRGGRSVAVSLPVTVNILP